MSIMGDWNMDVRLPEFTLWRESLGLKDYSLGSLDNFELAPATHIRGSKPIDSILTTHGIEII